MNHFAIVNMLGLSPDLDDETNMAQLSRLWNHDPAHAQLRGEVGRAMRLQSMEFSEHNVEYGFTFDSSGVIPDGTEAPEPVDDIRVYRPSARPGAPLPHAWVEDARGERRPIKDLVAPGGFLLIAGEDGAPWVEAARRLAADTGLPLDALRIGHVDGDLYDPRSAWARQRGIDADGAVLVRPDRVIAWRSRGAADDPRRTLADALGRVLGTRLKVADGDPVTVRA